MYAIMDYIPTTRFCLLIVLLLLLVDIRITLAIRLHNPTRNPETIYDALRSYGLPSGLLPKGVRNFSIDEFGNFKVHLDQACDAKFENELHYDRNVSGSLVYGQIGNLTGMSAQDLFLWFPVYEIRVDIPSSGLIYFDVGVVKKRFSLSSFETPLDCVATTLPAAQPEVVFGGRTRVFDFLSKKLEGMLRYGRFNELKSGREVM